jgi:hypothetical protein
VLFVSAVNGINEIGKAVENYQLGQTQAGDIAYAT